jgi:hypothetical protein
VLKTTNESVTSSTTFQNDDHLVLTLGANETWEFEGWIVASVGNNNAPDFKYRFVLPAGASIIYNRTHQLTTASSASEFALVTAASGASSEFSIDMASNNVFLVRVRGVVTNGNTAGNLQFQWAQNSSHSTATTVQAGSFIKAGKF